MISLGITIQWEEMIPVPDGVNAQFFGCTHSLREVLIAGVLWVQLNTHPNGMCRRCTGHE
jgi:hypothetical protein